LDVSLGKPWLKAVSFVSVSLQIPYAASLIRKEKLGAHLSKS